MFDFARDLYRHATRDARASGNTGAVAIGALLGVITRELARIDDGSGRQMIAALVVVLAGSAAFVLHALHRQSLSLRLSRLELQTRAWSIAGLVGIAVIGSIFALQALA